MTWRAWSLCLLLCVVLVSCDRDFSVFEPPTTSREFTPIEKSVAQSDNAFGLRLFRKIADSEKNKNVLISPLSAAMALGMALNGAAGETETAMRNALGLAGMERDEINTAFQGLIEVLSGLDPAVRFQIANSIWHELGLEIEPDFIRTNKTYFNALVQGLDFNSPEAPGVINQWVSEKTYGKIPEIVDGIDQAQVLFVINAIAFKGNWTTQFDPKNTTADFFLKADGTQVPCDMMRLETGFDYYRNGSFEAVDLPYGGGDFSMTVFLPNPGTPVDVFIKGLSADSLDVWSGKMQKNIIVLQLPKFKLQYEIRLNDALSALGMGIAFTDRADFTRILKGGGIQIDEVKQKTYIDVNEEGTEAAAVTAISFTVSMPYLFRADRPFVFLIRERRSGTILFMGKIEDPSINQVTS
jgi:serpin B